MIHQVPGASCQNGEEDVSIKVWPILQHNHVVFRCGYGHGWHFLLLTWRHHWKGPQFFRFVQVWSLYTRLCQLRFQHRERKKHRMMLTRFQSFKFRISSFDKMYKETRYQGAKISTKTSWQRLSLSNPNFFSDLLSLKDRRCIISGPTPHVWSLSLLSK